MLRPEGGTASASEWTQVDAGCPKHAGQAGGNQQRRLSGQREVQPCERHQQAGDRERSAPSETGSQACRHEARQGRGGKSEPEGQPDQGGREPAALEVNSDQDRRKSEAESAQTAGGQQQRAVHLEWTLARPR